MYYVVKTYIKGFIHKVSVFIVFKLQEIYSKAHILGLKLVKKLVKQDELSLKISYIYHIFILGFYFSPNFLYISYSTLNSLLLPWRENVG